MIPTITGTLASPTYMTDFDVLRFGGQAASHGYLAWGYDASWKGPVSFDGEAKRSMPFAYPPQAALLFVPLAWLPTLAGYLAFDATTLILFVTGIMGLAQGRTRWAILLFAVPAVAIDCRGGQNGLLSAGLCAHATRLWLAGRPGLAGILAGLATFKPHVALGLPAALLRHQRTPRRARPRHRRHRPRHSRLRDVRPEGLRGLHPRRRRIGEGPHRRPLPAGPDELGLRERARLRPRATNRTRRPRRVVPRSRPRLRVGGKASRRPPRHSRADDRRSDLFSPYGYDYDLATLSVAAALLSALPFLRGRLGLALLVCASATPLAGFAWWTDGGKGGVVAMLLIPLVVAVGAVVGGATTLNLNKKPTSD